MIFSIILGVILGIAIPTLLPIIFKITLTLDSQIIIGLLATIIPVLIDLSKDIEWLKKNGNTEKIILDNLNNFDKELQKISHYFADFDDVKDKGIFATYFQKEIITISLAMLDASQKKKFWGRVQNIVNEKYIMDCFGLSESRIWKFTWVITSDDSPLNTETDVAWLTYWNLAISMLNQKRISEIDILFIAQKDLVQKVISEVTELAAYFNGLIRSSFIKTKIIMEIEYNQKFKSVFNNSKNQDFGIYGDNLLFVYDSDNDGFGWYIENKDEIKEYSIFFDAVWISSSDIKRK